MPTDYEGSHLESADEAYFDDRETKANRRFDEELLRAPICVLSRRIPMVFS